MNKGIGANECLSCPAWFTLCDLCFMNKGIGANECLSCTAWFTLCDLCFMNKGIGANECLSCPAWFTLCDLCFRNKGIGAMIARKARNIISRVRHKCFNTFHFTGFILSFSFIYYVFTVIKKIYIYIADIRVHTIFVGGCVS